MTRLSQYSQAFWGSDFTSTRGFDTLSQRMKDGKNLCKELEDYLKQRYEMEKNYAKDLQKLFKNMKQREDMGVLEKSWNTLREEIEKIHTVHHEAASLFQRQMEDIKKFNESQAGKRKVTEEQVKRYQTNKNNLYNKCMGYLKTYKDKCREKDTAFDSYNSMKSSVTTLAKDLDKALKTKTKTEEDSNKAETMYKTSVDSLESARTNWEKEMQEACELFQKLDEERIRYVRECLWVSVNIDSQCAVDVDNSCENVRCVLEKCRVEDDICTFIEKFSTGTDRPAPIVFENYYANVEIPARGQAQRSGGHRGQRSQGGHNGITTMDGLYAVVDEDAGGLYAGLSDCYQIDNKQSQSIKPSSQTSDGSLLTITKSHCAQTASELSVAVGQRVYYVRKMDTNYVQVRLEGSNRHGIIPNSCVQQYL